MNNDETTQEPTKPDPILEAIQSLKEDIGAVNARFDEYDAKLTSTPTQTAEEIAKYVTPTDEEPEWQPKKWGDVTKMAQAEAEQVAKAILDEREQAAKKAQEEQAANEAKFQKTVDQQLDELTKEGYLPAMASKDNPEDSGRKARAELLAACVHLKSADIPSVAKMLKAQHDAGLSFDTATNQFIRSNPTLPGKYVPVGSSSATTGANTNTGLDYKQVHNMSMDQIIEAGQRS